MATENFPTYVAGIRNTNNLGTDERPKNFREAILWLDPAGMTPLTAISAKMKSEPTDDPEFSWWEEVLDAKRGELAADPTGGSFTLKAGSEATGVRAENPARQFSPGDLLQLRDASGEPTDYKNNIEIVKVTSIDGDTTMTVTRGYAGTTITAVTGDSLLLVGKVFEEGSGGASSRTSNPVKFNNYTQIFKTAFEETGTSSQTNYRTGKAFDNDRKRAMFNHSEAMEQAFFWGVAGEKAGANGRMERTMGGIRSFLSSHVNVSVGSVTDNFFLDSVSGLFDFNAGGAGDERICFVGNGAINKFQKAFRDSNPLRITYNGKVTFLGMKLLEFQIPQGTFMLKSHPLMNTDPIYTNSMFVINPKGILRRPMKGRDTKIQKNIQAPDEDLRKDQWLTEVGMELHYERTMGYFGGIT